MEIRQQDHKAARLASNKMTDGFNGSLGIPATDADVEALEQPLRQVVQTTTAHLIRRGVPSCGKWVYTASGDKGERTEGKRLTFLDYRRGLLDLVEWLKPQDAYRSFVSAVDASPALKDYFGRGFAGLTRRDEQDYWMPQRILLFASCVVEHSFDQHGNNVANVTLVFANAFAQLVLELKSPTIKRVTYCPLYGLRTDAIKSITSTVSVVPLNLEDQTALINELDLNGEALQNMSLLNTHAALSISWIGPRSSESGSASSRHIQEAQDILRLGAGVKCRVAMYFVRIISICYGEGSSRSQLATNR